MGYTLRLNLRVSPGAGQARWSMVGMNCRADSRFAPSQWETSLQSNAVSHWLGASLESYDVCQSVGLIPWDNNPTTVYHMLHTPWGRLMSSPTCGRLLWAEFTNIKVRYIWCIFRISQTYQVCTCAWYVYDVQIYVYDMYIMIKISHHDMNTMKRCRIIRVLVCTRFKVIIDQRHRVKVFIQRAHNLSNYRILIYTKLQTLTQNARS